MLLSCVVAMFCHLTNVTVQNGFEVNVMLLDVTFGVLVIFEVIVKLVDVKLH